MYLFTDAESEAGQEGFSTVIAMDSDHLLTHYEPCEVNRWVGAVANFTGRIEKALGPGKADEVMSEGFRISMKHSNCWSLRSGEWLNDQVCRSLVLTSSL